MSEQCFMRTCRQVIKWQSVLHSQAYLSRVWRWRARYLSVLSLVSELTSSSRGAGTKARAWRATCTAMVLPSLALSGFKYVNLMPKLCNGYMYRIMPLIRLWSAPRTWFLYHILRFCWSGETWKLIENKITVLILKFKFWILQRPRCHCRVVCSFIRYNTIDSTCTLYWTTGRSQWRPCQWRSQPHAVVSWSWIQASGRGLHQCCWYPTSYC